MSTKNTLNRRALVRSTIFGMLAVSTPNVLYSRHVAWDSPPLGTEPGKLFHRYPSIDDEIVSEVVGKSHFDLDRVKELVSKRPELARATWDWAFGDWESAIGAASHVGRRDIVQFLMSKGARPNLFTFAMLGAYEVVKSTIAFSPGIQKTMGPHGISLLSHARVGLRMEKDMSPNELDHLKRTIDFLESLGDADGETYLEVSPEDQKKYLGDYKYGDGEKDGFTIRLNMRKLLSLGRLGQSGGALYKIGENTFTYNGVPSVNINFEVEQNVVKSLTVHEPELTLTAKKI